MVYIFGCAGSASPMELKAAALPRSYEKLLLVYMKVRFKWDLVHYTMGK